MKSIFFDTETTGLKPGQIGQLTYIIEEDNEFKAAKNFFFTVDIMDPSAEKVHGFSMELLEKLSGGKRIEHSIEEIKRDFENATLIAHNVNFDLKFLQAEFERVGIPLNIKRTFCTMNYFKGITAIPARTGEGFKNPKLEEVVNHYVIDRENIMNATKKLYNCGEVSYHDARYDTTAMYVCCLISRERFEVYDLLEDDGEDMDQMSLF